MTAPAALLDFFANAIPGWGAYPETAVPSQVAGDSFDAAFPYLTYSLPTSSFDAGEVSISVNLWAKKRVQFPDGHSSGETEQTMNDAAETLRKAVGRGGVRIPFDGDDGEECFIWLKPGTPFAQALADEDPTMKRRYINLIAEWQR